MINMNIQTGPELEHKPEASSSTAKGKHRLSGDLPPAYEEDERAQAAVAILTDGIPYGILATTVTDWAELEISRSPVASSTTSSPPTCSRLRPSRPPLRSGRDPSSLSFLRSPARLPTFFCAWAPPPRSCWCSGPGSPRCPSSPARRRATTQVRSTGSTRPARSSPAMDRRTLGNFVARLGRRVAGWPT
jgi:hypothetical protein